MSEEFNKQDFNSDKETNNQQSKPNENHPLEEEKDYKRNKPVIIKAEAYKTIILYSSRYANNYIPAKEWKEIYGILIGYSDENFVYIEKAEALTYGHATDVQLDEKHYGFIEEIQEKLEKDENTKNFYMIGWFHSHPGLGLFFSYIDLLNQLGFQARNDDFCGLVFDHTLLGRKKKEDIEGTEHKITKYDTGFEIYRISNVNIDINSPRFESNYHKVDYIVEGLNKFFFANVLSELSALVSAGKPLESAYGEKKSKHFSKKKEISTDKLVKIPVSDGIEFDSEEIFYGTLPKKHKKKNLLREEAERYVYEGNQAFQQNNTFLGVEKYQQAIKTYKNLDEYDRVLELLRTLSDHCTASNHHILAKQFSEELYNLSEKYKNLFFRAEANYLLGNLLLKESNIENLEPALKKIQNGSIDFEKAGDFAGAGRCYNKIGSIYQNRLNKPYNACLFYEEAIRNYNNALFKGHPLRSSLWSKSEVLTQKILELKNIVDELIPTIENGEERTKIKDDLNSIQLNF